VADDNEQVEAPSKPPIFENKAVMLAVMVVLQAGLAFAAMKFVIQPTLAPPEVVGEMADGEAGAATRQRGILVSMEEMVVSLSSADRPRYLRTNIAVEAVDDAAAALVTERMAEFRDSAIMQLSSHAAMDLLSFEGKESVKAEIKESLKSLLDEGEILNIYYSDFVVQ
jgi:flagellar protein FliL